MKIKYALLLTVLIASAIVPRVTADSKEDVVGAKDPSLLKPNDSNEVVNSVKTEAGKVDKNDPKEQLGSIGRGDVQNKANGGVQKDVPKENQGSDSKFMKESEEGRLPPAKEKCDSSSNSCTDDAKSLVACLRVPGNELQALCLLIQNKGKGPMSITISAPDTVKVEERLIELPENQYREVQVPITGSESGQFIILSAGHGNCSLEFTDQLVGRNTVDHTHDSSYLNMFKPTSSMGFLFLAGLLIVLVSIFLCTRLGKRYFTRFGPKYQKLDMELPVSHGSKLESSENEGWDDSWGDSWDDEEAAAPVTPTLPVTPSLSSKGMASRKINKEGWKD